MDPLLYGDVKTKYMNRLQALETERSSWIAHWRELSDYIMPRRTRFLATDRNKGGHRNDKLINNAPLRAARTLASGMMAGITSPARPWFRLTHPDPEIAEKDIVRGWLYHVEERLREVIARSNIYNALPLIYTDLGVFGTACALIDEDAEDVVRMYVLPLGSYCLANDARQRVDTIYEERDLTVAQLVTKFGLEYCSQMVKDAWRNKQYDTWVTVVHVIEPWMTSGQLPNRWKSVWYEKAANNKDILGQKGYYEFPAVCPRWTVTGEDVYGGSSGMDALGDAKAIQTLELRKAQVADKIVNPPMKGPSALRNGRASLLPGDITYVDVIQGGQNFTPAMEVVPAAIQLLDASIRTHVDRVDSTFFADLWLAILSDDRRQPVTAEEIRAKKEERMLQLGPVLERLNDELLDPMINRVFSIMQRKGLIPPPPPEIQGSALKVEYLSILTQAQKMLGISAVERLANFTAQMAQFNPQVLDKVNFDQVVEVYAAMLGVPPDVLMPDDLIESIRAERAKKQQAAEAAQAGVAASQAVKNLAQSDMEGQNALTQMQQMLGGGVNPVGVA